MDVFLKTSWSMHLSTEELVLICKALRGKLVSAEEIQTADILANAMAMRRAKTTEAMLKENQKLLDNLAKNQEQGA